MSKKGQDKDAGKPCILVILPLGIMPILSLCLTLQVS